MADIIPPLTCCGIWVRQCCRLCDDIEKVVVVPLHARSPGVVDFYSCNLLFLFKQCSISGVVAVDFRVQMRDSFCSGSKNHTTAHRYMVGGSNIEEYISVLLWLVGVSAEFVYRSRIGGLGKHLMGSQRGHCSHMHKRPRDALCSRCRT